MGWLFWKKRKKRTNAGVSEVTLRVGGVKEYDAAIEAARESTGRVYAISDHPALMSHLQDAAKERIVTSAELRPTIIEVTNPLDWKGYPIGQKFGPARCNETCDQVHAYAVKTSPTTVSFERPCESADAGAAEWRARQKR